MTGEVALEAADRLPRALSLRLSALDVGDRRRVVHPTREDDRVQGAVQCPVPAAIETPALPLARGGGDRRSPSVAGKGSLAGEATGVRPGDKELRGRDRADAALAKQRRGLQADEGEDPAAAPRPPCLRQRPGARRPEAQALCRAPGDLCARAGEVQGSGAGALPPRARAAPAAAPRGRRRRARAARLGRRGGLQLRPHASAAGSAAPPARRRRVARAGACRQGRCGRRQGHRERPTCPGFSLGLAVAAPPRAPARRGLPGSG